jgi:hypothetical protein
MTILNTGLINNRLVKVGAALISELHQIVSDTHGESFLRIPSVCLVYRTRPGTPIYFQHIRLL